jgi:hypothetical protein
MREELGRVLFLRFMQAEIGKSLGCPCAQRLREDAKAKGINPKPYVLPEVESAISDCQLGDFREPHRADPNWPNAKRDHQVVMDCKKETAHRRVRKMAVTAYAAHEAPGEARRLLALVHPCLTPSTPPSGPSTQPDNSSNNNSAADSSVAEGGQ